MPDEALASTTVIADLVGSRTSIDRRALHHRFDRALADVNTLLTPPTPLRITVGDECQGVLATLGDAITASLVLRLALLPEADVRTGLGRGEVTVLAVEPRVEDGPGWWAARAAIEEVEAAAARPGTRGVRTAYAATAPGGAAAGAGGGAAPGGEEAAVNAALVLRDQVVSGLSERGVSVLRGLLSGRTQSEVAHDLGISASAVSQRVRSDGTGALLAAHRLLAALD